MIIWNAIRPYLSDTVRFFHISYIEAKSRYRDSRLGLLWIPFSTLIFTSMLALVFRDAGSMELSTFYLYVLSGYVLWQFILASIVGSTDVIQKRLEFAIHNDMTLAGLFGKQLVDRLFEYGLNLILLAVAALLLTFDKLGVDLLLFAPFLFLIVVTSLAISYLVNITTIFFPDLSTLITTATRFLFFASPVFWVASETTGVRLFLVQFNPVSYYLGMTRQVFGITPIEASAWIGSCGISAVLCLAGYIAYARSKSFVRNIK